jgi:tetratricopeptide (TPR) repeat protein
MTDAPSSGARPGTTEATASFEEGLARYRRGDAVEAHGLFERAHRRAPADARIMSWYGLTLVLVERNSNLGIIYCDQALRLAGPEPELFLNQARAHLALGQRERAVKAVVRGLSAAPLDPALKAAQACMGWRRRPVFPCFGRSNPLNRWLGRLRHRWSQHMHPIPPVTPMTLGLLPDEGEPKTDDGESKS